MRFAFTINKLARCIPNNKQPEVWFGLLNEHLPNFRIDTVERVAGFISQCQHESNDFTILQENLNYSWQGLRATFPKYFPTDSEAQKFHRRPELIANRVYANRMANGNEASGDGWKFRGRGIIQITGRHNYTECSRYLFKDDRLVDNPDMLTDPTFAILGACWFWERNKLNEICDRRDVVLLSRRINGGTIGLDDRLKKWDRAIAVLSENSQSASIPIPQRVLRIGTKGDDVAALQRKLGLRDDGDFGPATEAALMKWQRTNNLYADGIAGPATNRILFG
jgi:putative chitinase